MTMRAYSGSFSTTCLVRALGALTMLSLLALSLPGCSQPTMFQNPDPNLRKSNSQFRADAATRFPYKLDAPHQRETRARAQVGYALNRLEVVNYSGEEWTDVEVWVNREYVCFVPVMQDRQLKEVHFPMLYDSHGKTFPMHGSDNLVTKVELYRNGVMYEITCHNGDY